jgi:hypothetical protein
VRLSVRNPKQKRGKKHRLARFEVNSWNELLNTIEKAKSQLKEEDDEELWYRGVSRSDYQLIPSLLRCFKPQDRVAENIRKLETDLFFEFLAKARTNATLSEWDVLFLMQHYRAPTRLLDWTEILFVALYFATAYRTQNDTSQPRLYVINPYWWNEKHGYDRDLWWPKYFGYDDEKDYFYEYGEMLIDDEIDWKAPLALYPPQREERLSAQRGFFTIHGTDLRPLEEIAPRQVIAIDLTAQATEEVKRILNYGGVNEYSLFPDLEGLSRHLRIKYGV